MQKNYKPVDIEMFERWVEQYVDNRDLKEQVMKG